MNGINYQSQCEELSKQGEELHNKYLLIKALVSKKADEILLNNIGLKLFEEFYDFLSEFYNAIFEYRNRIDPILNDAGIFLDNNPGAIHILNSKVVLSHEVYGTLIRSNTLLHLEKFINKLEKEIDALFEYLLKFLNQSYDNQILNQSLNNNLEKLGYFINGVPDFNDVGFKNRIGSYIININNITKDSSDFLKNYELKILVDTYKGTKINTTSIVNFLNKTIEYLDANFCVNNKELYKNINYFLGQIQSFVKNISILDVNEEIPENGDIKPVLNNIATIVLEKLEETQQNLFHKQK